MHPARRRPAGVNEKNTRMEGLYLVGGVKDLRDMIHAL